MSTPAARILEKFGGDYEVVAKAAGVDVSRVYRWTYPKNRGGTDGEIPQDRWPKLIANAKERGVDLTIADLLPDHLAEHLPPSDQRAS